MSNDVVCCWRGSDEIDSGLEHLDETKVQLLYTKFLVGSGTYKRTKFLYVQYIGPKCGIVKRGQAIGKISLFAEKHMQGVAGFSTTDKESLSFESLVKQFRNIFITDNGQFSLDQIRSEYRARLEEEQRMMHQEGKKVHRKVPRGTRPQVQVQMQVKPQPKPDELEVSMPRVTSDEATKRVIDALRADDGPVNWAIFAAEPAKARITSYGRGGIFEMVKNLPEDQWLFGLFRISFFMGEQRERRMIFFQWIGSKLRAVRSAGSHGIYPGMAKLLAPFAYEIYLVGAGDLNAQAIINKSKNAFNDSRKKNSAGGKDMSSFMFTEDNYKASLDDEQKAAGEFDPFQPIKRPRRNTMTSAVIEEGMEQSLPSMDNGITNSEAPLSFEIEETLDLVQCDEGGLVWAIFEVKS